MKKLSRSPGAPRLPRWVALILVVVLSMGLYSSELYRIQIVEGDEYRTSAERTGTQKVEIEAARGEILDRNGNELVVNSVARNIVFNKAYMRDVDLNQVILRLCNLLEQNGEQWINKLPIRLNSDGEFEFEKDRDYDVQQIISYCRLQSYATAENCVDALIKKYECEKYSRADALKIVSVRNQMRAEDYSFQYPYTFAKNVSDKTIAVIMENHAEFGDVSITNTTNRDYVAGDLAAHVIGHVGALSAEEYNALKASGYKLTDEIGKFGLELAAENYLRGKSGTREITYGSSGTVKEVKNTVLPTAGNTVYSTIDQNLQQVVQQALADNVQTVKDLAESTGDTQGADCSGAAAVVMDVRNASVLAMASYPTFDLSKYAEEMVRVSQLDEQDKSTPLVNRATYSAYPPGSVMKPAVALAGLNEGEIKIGETINCTHIYQRFLPEQFQCLGYHGATDVRYGLQVSCNIFFYEAGYRLGIDRMNAYCKRLGLGEKTGIEIGDVTGTLAGRAEREAAGSTQGWYPGDTIQAAIGQSDNQFTAIQLASYISTIANGGKRYQPHLIKKVTTYDRTQDVLADQDENPTLVEDLTDIAPEYYQEVQAGMRQAILGGSVQWLLAKYPIAMAGKTGTAQVSGGSDNGVLAVYAPYDDPQICIVVVLEHGGHGYNAAYAVKTIADAYFKLGDFAESKTEENIDKTASETDQNTGDIRQNDD